MKMEGTWRDIKMTEERVMKTVKEGNEMTEIPL